MTLNTLPGTSTASSPRGRGSWPSRRSRRCPTPGSLAPGRRCPAARTPTTSRSPPVALGLRLRHVQPTAANLRTLLHSDRQRARPRPGGPVRADRPGHGTVRCAHVQPRQPAAPRARARGDAVDRRAARGTAAPRRRRRPRAGARRRRSGEASTRWTRRSSRTPTRRTPLCATTPPVVPVAYASLWFFLLRRLQGDPRPDARPSSSIRARAVRPRPASSSPIRRTTPGCASG